MSERLSSSRLEAFSDGVIAVIITVMVLELHVPAHDIADHAALLRVLPLVLVYALSFVQTGIYWVNHHYLIDDVEQVSHGILWSNLVFLFSLSLFPFATAWVGERGVSSFSIALYATVSVLPAMTYNALAVLVSRRAGVPEVAGRVKPVVSSVLYLGAIPCAFISPWLALSMLVTVAVLWLIPPRRIVEISRKPSHSDPQAPR